MVSEEKFAGNYEIEFNAISLPSGIYFYTLSSGNFTDSKKLILLK
ncbi:MAG: T9SS type A sorting domain-containing protein [Ignavibacteriaceae bacterium]